MSGLELYGAEQRAIGKYFNKIQEIRGWSKNPKVDEEEVCELLGLTREQLDQIVSLIEEGRSDEEIYEEVEWHISSNKQ